MFSTKKRNNNNHECINMKDTLVSSSESLNHQEGSWHISSLALFQSTKPVPMARPTFRQKMSGMLKYPSKKSNPQQKISAAATLHSKTLIISQLLYLVLTDFQIFLKFLLILIIVGVFILGVLHYLTKILTALMGSLKWIGVLGGNTLSLGKIISWFI
ncbi:hypothetical protein WICPIJ_007632 [Wickerhamomyces pijperi]|uniref:Uncharacterized protein n=1 Tax=Wickerhamomyces pijperi TaxID=599730 RepID=A0A9P8PZV1_WICPI|nr:hypothetical protein WICPIJ_007632 [Wickerhamomyces pijperi]